MVWVCQRCVSVSHKTGRVLSRMYTPSHKRNKQGLFLRSKLHNNETSKRRDISMNIFIYIYTYTVSHTYKYVYIIYLYIYVYYQYVFSQTKYIPIMYSIFSLPICMLLPRRRTFLFTHPAGPREALALDLDQVTSKVKAVTGFVGKQHFWETKNPQIHEKSTKSCVFFLVGCCCVWCFFLGVPTPQKNKFLGGFCCIFFCIFFFEDCRCFLSF